MDPFDAFDSSRQQDGNEKDPAADFLAREQAELAKIENNEGDFFSNANNDSNSAEFTRK